MKTNRLKAEEIKTLRETLKETRNKMERQREMNIRIQAEIKWIRMQIKLLEDSRLSLAMIRLISDDIQAKIDNLLPYEEVTLH